MNSLEWKRLRQFHNLNQIQHSHKPILEGRRHVKGRAKHYGAILKKSSIKYQVVLLEQRP